MKDTYQAHLDDYAGYHRNHKNKLTHYFGIPMIVFAIVVLLQLVPLGSLGSLPIDAALIALVPVCVFYLYLNALTGLGMALVFTAMYLTAPFVTQPIAWILFFLGWVLQFIGHGYEGKKPAFFRNAVHLLIGPLWILNDLFLKLRLPAYRPLEPNREHGR